MDAYMLRCDGCGVEITWAPLVRRAADSTHRYHYCCQECLRGLECACAERLEGEDERAATDPVTHKQNVL